MVFYDSLRGEIILTDRNIVVPAKPFKKGDIVGCTLWLFGLERHETVYSSIQFSVNGQTTSLQNHSLKGETITPTVYAEDTDRLLDINLGERQFQFQQGNGNMNLFQIL